MGSHGSFDQNQQQQNYQNQQLAVSNRMQKQANQGDNQFDSSTRSQLPLLEQQTQQLVGQINSQFHLGGKNSQQTIASMQNFGDQPQSVNFQEPPRDIATAQANRMQQQPVPNINNQSIFGQVQLQQNAPQQQQQFDSTSANQFQQQQPSSLHLQQLQQQHMNPMPDQQVEPIQSTGTQQLLGPIQQLQQFPPTGSRQQSDDVAGQSNYPMSQINLMNLQQQHAAGLSRGGLLMGSQPDALLCQQQLAAHQAMMFRQQQQLDSSSDAYQLQDSSFRGQQSPAALTSNIYKQAYAHCEQPDGAHDARRDIRFGPHHQPAGSLADPDYERALSDQELGHHVQNRRNPGNQAVRRYDSSETNAPATTSRSHGRSRSQRDLQAYDLAQRTTMPNRHRSRQLPAQPGADLNQHQQQPVADRSLQSSSEHLHETSSQAHAKTSSNKSTGRRAGKGPSSRQGHRSESRQHSDSPQYLSDSEDIEDDLGSRPDVSDTKNKQTRTTSSASNKHEQNQNDSKAIDKSEKALQLLSELKLTEQANQVMEHQQLLIKQSQELIKLQQAQLEQQQALKQQADSNKQRQAQQQQSDTPGKDSNQEDATGRGDLEDKNTRELGQRESKECDKQPQQHQSQDNEYPSRQQQQSIQKADRPADDRGEPVRGRLAGKKSTSFSYDLDSDSEDLATHRTPSKAASTRSADVNDDDTNTGEQYERNKYEPAKRGIKKSTGASMAPSNLPLSQAPSASPKYNRDLMQSPTDTTDSDVDLMSQSTGIHQRRHLKHSGSASISSARPRSVMRRREPAGLPPSPLPVAAAIQLHQMQQQHAKQQLNQNRGPQTNLNRANFLLRSRSVTSSPNHIIERANGGYLTDGHHTVRPSSPDTLSEYGGQRRRKRLPEPPQNAVPITPSMVRKMIQAQKIAGTNFGKLLTSVNAQSTLLANTHSSRSPALDRPLNHDPSFHQPPRASALDSIGLRQASNFNASLNRFRVSSAEPSMAPTTTISHANSLAATTKPGSQEQQQLANKSDLNTFLTSTYGNSILKNSANISDVKETPELDKLISNLDEYYGLDTNKRQVRLAAPTSQLSQASELRSSTYNNYNSLVAGTSLSPIRQQLGTLAPSATSTPPNQHFSSSRSIYQPFRRNSDGEHGLASRLADRSLYRPATNFEDQLKSNGASLTTSTGHTPYSLSSARARQHLPRDYQTPRAIASDRGLSSYSTIYDRQPTYRPPHQRNPSAYLGASGSSRFATSSFDSPMHRNHDYPLASLDQYKQPVASSSGPQLGFQEANQRRPAIGSNYYPNLSQTRTPYSGPADIASYGASSDRYEHWDTTPKYAIR